MEMYHRRHKSESDNLALQEETSRGEEILPSYASLKIKSGAPLHETPGGTPLHLQIPSEPEGHCCSDSVSVSNEVRRWTTTGTRLLNSVKPIDEDVKYPNSSTTSNNSTGGNSSSPVVLERQRGWQAGVLKVASSLQ